jgi:imidazolonepropionase-like amidohydrolase
VRTILCPQWLIDGTGSDAVADHAVVINGDVIETVDLESRIPRQDGDQTIPLAGITLIPGLINNHVHLVLPGDNTPFVPWIDLQSDAQLALRAAHNIKRSLHAGITTVRDCGGRGKTVFDVRDAQRDGLVVGARVISCGWPLTITGGHTRQFGGEADGVDELRRMVRRLISAGADYIKVMASGGGTPGSLPERPSFSRTELEAIVDTAHALGRRVATHCIAAESLANAISARTDFVEHGSFLGQDGQTHFDPALADTLATAEIPVTPTLQVTRDMVEMTPEGPERVLWQRRQESQRRIVQEFVKRGVTLLAGSDAGWRATAFDTFWKELDELVICGLTPIAAIHAATGAISRTYGETAAYGTICPGQVADLVAVEGELATDISCACRPMAVFQAGKLIHPPSVPTVLRGSELIAALEK